MPLTPVNTFDDFLSGYSLALRANEQDEARRARRRAEMLQDEERQEAKDRRAASQRLNSALYDRTVLMPEVLDAGDGRDFGATVDALDALVNESKLFAAADPVDQRAILNPLLANDRKLRSMQQASWLKRQFEQEKQQEQIKAVLGLGLSPEMERVVVGRILTGQPIPFEDNDTYSTEEWMSSPARQLLSPQVQQLADSWVLATGKFPPSSYFNTVFDPWSFSAWTNPSKNPEIANAMTSVQMAEEMVNQARANYHRVWQRYDHESLMDGQPSAETVQALKDAAAAIAKAEEIHRNAFLNLINLRSRYAALMPGTNPPGGPAPTQPVPTQPASTQPVPIQQPAAPTPAAAQPSAALQPSDVPQSVPYLSAMAPAPPAAPQPPAAPAATPRPVPNNADDITRKIAEAFAADRAMNAAREKIPKVNEEFQRRYGRPPTGTDREAWTAIMREMLGEVEQ